MKKYILYILLTVLAAKVNAQGGFKNGQRGTSYKIFTPNTGDKVKVGDVITFHVMQKTDKDSVLASTFKTGIPAKVQVQATGDMMDVFQVLALNDSVLVKVPTDTIFKTQEQNRPPFLPKGSNLFIVVKLIKIQSLAEAMADKQKEDEAAKANAIKIQAQEAVTADKYIAEHKMVLTTTASGLKYKLTKIGTKPKPLNGDTVYVNYVGHTLDGKVFDSSIESVAKAANLQQMGRVYEPINFALGAKGVIPGWEEGLLLINEGGKATFVIPSKLAYGANAAGPGIPAYSTLVFDVELVKVNRAKAVTAGKKPVASSTAKKPGAKKAAAKKPVAPKKK
jgi:FKBP-type peptidyl-prolyl cis-trans isomerase FkpA